MNRGQVAEKADGLMAPVIGTAASQALIDAIWTIDTAAEVRDLRPVLTA